jgi:sugar/nucleoside kinase (ribokinase family)
MMTTDTVVGVGHCAVDYLGLLPRCPERGESVEIAAFSQQGGGATATALATLATFGTTARFVGKISDDHFGDFIRLGLEGLGVDTSLVVVEEGKVSPFSFSAVEMDKGGRSVYWSRGNVGPLALADVPTEAVLAGADALIIDGMHREVQSHLAQRASRTGVKVIVDAGSFAADSRDLLTFGDVLVASERFASELAPAAELERSLHQLQELGPKTCVITLGPEGAVGIDADHEIHQEPAQCVDVVDTTGAGDVYLGALTYAILRNWPLARCMRFAGVAAGLKCQALGARAGIPELSQVLALAQKAGSP